MTIVLGLIFGVLLGYWASRIAASRGRSQGWAFTWGFFFSLICVAGVALFMKDQRLVTGSPVVH